MSRASRAEHIGDPQTAADALTRRGSGVRPASEPRGTLLIVDDEAGVREALGRALRQDGYTVATAGTAQEALALVDDQDFDTVISDITMPEMDGIDLLREIRRQDADLPVVLLTGKPAWETATEALEHRAFKYLTKPLGTEQLLETVDRAVSCRRMTEVRRQLAQIPGMPSSGYGDITALEVRFESALQKLYVVYQPIVWWQSRTLVGYEVLVRSREPSMPHPGLLIDAAERLQRLHDLGRRVRSSAVAHLSQVPDHVKLFINLHTRDLLDPDLFDPASPASQVAHRIVLELTERAKLEQVGDVAGRVARLRKLGYSIAIDDIGAGYAGLTSFAQLEPDVVKLDMALVRDVNRSKTKQKLIGVLVSLCGDLGMTVVAEGIETQAERDALQGLGCSWMQGYLFARPAETFESPNFD